MPTRNRVTARPFTRIKPRNWPRKSIEAAIACSRIAPAQASGKANPRAASIRNQVRKFYLG